MTSYIAAILIYSACAVTGYILIQRAESDTKHGKTILFAILLAGFALRSYFAAQNYAFVFDVGCFENWAEYTVTLGFGKMYSGGIFLDYPPLYMYFLWITQQIKTLAGAADGSVESYYIIKLIPMLTDILSGAVIYIFARRHTDEKTALFFAAAYVFCPMTVFNSAVWGQIDAVYTLFLALSLAFISDDKTIPAAVTYAAALLTKPQALLFGPVFLFAMIRRGSVKEMLKAVVTGCASLYILSLPFAQSLNPMWLVKLYKNTMGGYRYLSVNGYNLWTLLGKNWVSIDKYPGAEYINCAVIIILMMRAAYLFMRADKKTAVFSAAWLMISVIFTFCTMMHERYLFPSVLIAVFGFIFTKKGWFAALRLLSSVVSFFNIAMSMSAQYGPYYISVASQQTAGLMCVVVCVAGICVIVCDAAKNDEPHFVSSHKTEILLAVITVLYGIAAFYRLGSGKSPQTFWQNTEPGEAFVYTFDDWQRIREIWTFSGEGDEYYPEFCAKTGCSLTVSAANTEGEASEITHITHENPFGWVKTDADVYTDCLIITADNGYQVLNEIVVINADGNIVRGRITSSSTYGDLQAGFALDESETVPVSDDEKYYSAADEEIPLVTAAYETAKGYALTGEKQNAAAVFIISLAVKILGNTPFAWRFFGCLSGVLLTPVIYGIFLMLTGGKKKSLIRAAALSPVIMYAAEIKTASALPFMISGIAVIILCISAAYRHTADGRKAE